jgi:GH24 family phage-related lysozyme (muramidase)
LGNLQPVSLTPKLTERGLHVIKQWERFRATPYHDGFRKDGSKILSIGFGHSDTLLKETVSFVMTDVWTEEYAHEVLLKDLEYFGKLLLPNLKRAIPDSIWSICLSLSMNKGVSRLVSSAPWQILHDTGEYPFENFCESILKYAIHAPNKITGEMEEKRGLRWRRQAESALFLQDRFTDYL